MHFNRVFNQQQKRNVILYIYNQKIISLGFCQFYEREECYVISIKDIKDERHF